MDQLQAAVAVIENSYDAHEHFFQRSHDSETPPCHRDLIDLLWSRHPRKALLMFRGSGKTTRVEERITILRCLRRYHYIIILSSSEERAQQRLAKVKFELETNDDLNEVFNCRRRPNDVWQSSRIVVDGGIQCIQAVGSGQSVLGLKHLDWRPDYVFVDDLEEMSENCDNVSTPEKREKLANWFYEAFLPAIPHASVVMAGTMLHEDCLIANAVRSQDWKSIVVPLEIVSESGEHASSWPSRYPMEWITKQKEEYRRAGKQDVWERQYQCRPGASTSRSFRQSMFVFDEARKRTFEPVYVLYDPARTVGPTSCATGKAVVSWVANKILVWEASKAYWQPSEIIEDCFRCDDEFKPVQIGIEETGLNQFILEPIRSRQVASGRSLPIRPLNPPRGPGKDNFILRLQPHFAAGEVIFCGPREQFQDCIDQLVGFPYGEKDIINALAYILEISPGVALYEFEEQHVCDESGWENRRADWFLGVNSDGRYTTGSLLGTEGRMLCCVADWITEGDAGQALESLFRNACLACGQRPLVYAPKEHFSNTSWQGAAIGMRAAASGANINLLQAGDIFQGRDELRRLMTVEHNKKPLFQVSQKASWTIRALSGGYARMPDKKEPIQNQYAVLMQAIESFAAVFAGGLQFDDESLNWKWKNGKRYLSAQV